MTHRVRKSTSNRDYNQFPPEADDVFEVVSQERIDAVRAEMAERFGVGKGRLESLDVVTVG